MPLSDLRYQKKRRDLESLIEHTDSFKLIPRFITRPWTFNFRDGLIKQTEYSLKKRLDLVAELVDYGLSGIEILYQYEINEENLDFFQKFVRGNFLRLASIVVDYSFDPAFESGSLSSPVKKIRNQAIEHLKAALEISEELNTDYTLIMLNNDGYESAFGLDLTAARDRFATGVAEALEAVSSARIAFQTTQTRQHQHSLFHSASDLIMLCQKIESLITNPDLRERMYAGHTVITVAPDLKYIAQTREEPASAANFLMEGARLAGISYCTFPHATLYGANEISEDSFNIKGLLYALKMTGFIENMSLQVDSHIAPPVQALKNLMDKFRAYIAFVNYLDDDKIILSHMNPGNNKGWLEAYLVRANSPHVNTLPPLEFFQM